MVAVSLLEWEREREREREWERGVKHVYSSSAAGTILQQIWKKNISLKCFSNKSNNSSLIGLPDFGRKVDSDD